MFPDRNSIKFRILQENRIENIYVETYELKSFCRAKIEFQGGGRKRKIVRKSNISMDSPDSWYSLTNEREICPRKILESFFSEIHGASQTDTFK